MTETGQGRRARGAAGAGVFCWGFQSDFINEMGGWMIGKVSAAFTSGA